MHHRQSVWSIFHNLLFSVCAKLNPSEMTSTVETYSKAEDSRYLKEYGDKPLEIVGLVCFVQFCGFLLVSPYQYLKNEYQGGRDDV